MVWSFTKTKKYSNDEKNNFFFGRIKKVDIFIDEFLDLSWNFKWILVEQFLAIFLSQKKFFILGWTFYLIFRIVRKSLDYRCNSTNFEIIWISLGAQKSVCCIAFLMIGTFLSAHSKLKRAFCNAILRFSLEPNPFSLAKFWIRSICWLLVSNDDICIKTVVPFQIGIEVWCHIKRIIKQYDIGVQPIVLTQCLNKNQLKYRAVCTKWINAIASL